MYLWLWLTALFLGCLISVAQAASADSTTTAIETAGSHSMDTGIPEVNRIADTQYDWTGAYIGAHLGYAAGSSRWSATEAGSAGPNFTGSLDFYKGFNFSKGTGSYFAGFQAGYNTMLPSHLMLGIEGDVSFPNTIKGEPANFVVIDRPSELRRDGAVFRHGARPHRLPISQLANLWNRRVRLDLRSIHTSAACWHADRRDCGCGHRRICAPVANRLDARSRDRGSACIQLDCEARISVHPFRHHQRKFSSRGAALRFRPEDARAPAWSELQFRQQRRKRRRPSDR